MESNKKNNIFSNFAIIVLVGILILIFIGFIIYNNKQSSEDEKTNLNEITFNGLFKNNNINILLYEEDNSVYYVTSLDYPRVYSLGKLKKEENKAIGKVTITLDNNSIIVQNSSILDGKYIKDKDITFEEFWNVGYGNSKLFNSKFNGKYIIEDGFITIYQSDEQKARVLINYKNEKVSYDFLINEHGSLSYYNQEYKYMILYSEDDANKIIFRKQKISANEVEYEYILSKESNVDMKEIINSEVDFK